MGLSAVIALRPLVCFEPGLDGGSAVADATGAEGHPWRSLALAAPPAQRARRELKQRGSLLGGQQLVRGVRHALKTTRSGRISAGQTA